MKNKLRLLVPFIILIFLFGEARSQTNSYFQNNPVWKISSGMAVPYPCIKSAVFNYYLNGDTIINSLTYFKVYQKETGSFNWMASPPAYNCSGTYTDLNPNPICFVRSAGKQIFRIFPSDTSEVLLYDFNLSINDTLPITPVNWESGVYVSSIDSIFTPYGYLKRFTLAGSSGSCQYLIEGIGSSKGFLEPMGPIFEGGYDLECFSLNDTAYYPSIGPTCNLNLGIGEPYELMEFSVYPNPSNSIFNVEYNLKIPEQLIFELTDISGKIISSKSHYSVMGTNQLKFDFENLPAGIYFLNINNENGLIQSKKVIKE